MRKILIVALLAAALRLAPDAAAQSLSNFVDHPLGFVAVKPDAGFPSSIGASGSWSSGVFPMRGYRGISASITSTQSGVISIQRYLDAAGQIPIGAAISQPISASTLATVSVNDGLPAGYFQVTITNAGGSTATVTTPAIVLTGL